MSSRHLTQWAAQFAVASELCKRGYDVGFTMGHSTPLADLFVTAPDNRTTFLIDVKGQSTKSFWRIKAKPDRADLFYVLAYVPRDADNQYFILHQRDMNRLISEYAESGVKYDPRFSGVNWTTPFPFEGEWKLLPH